MKWTYLVLLGLLFVAVAVCVFFLPNSDYRLVAQKMATELIMPSALVFAGLLVATISSFRQGANRAAWVCLGTLAVHGLGTSGPVSGFLAKSLERDYFPARPLEEEPFDAVVVLGGGTSETPGGVPQLDRSGDRLALAARMYHRGLAPIIYCTGQRIRATSQMTMDSADQARAILIDWGVPTDAIRKLDGQNTHAEMEELAKQYDASSRIGILTSAWHMKRALRLARSRNLDLIALPADFICMPLSPLTPGAVVPSASAALVTRNCLKEQLAWLFGR